MKNALALAACFPCGNAGDLRRGLGADPRGGVVRDSRVRSERAVQRDLHFVALRSNDTGLVGGF